MFDSPFAAAELRRAQKPVFCDQLFRIHFNCRAAAAATFIGSLILGILASIGILPVRPWTASLGYGVFFLFLVYWQHIRRFFRFPIIVFFDKLCISQDQEDLKLKSIYGLASFLDRSDELVILWSDTYFSRLWCTYERLGLSWDQQTCIQISDVFPYTSSISI